jgi:SEC-C motif-containing protein
MKKTSHSDRTPCPCGSELPYVNCCGQWHAGLALGVHAPTPEALMRSRYSAYVLGLIEYLQATWHPSSAPGELELSPVKWLGLDVREAQTTGDAGVVEFVARFRVDGKGERLHEISRFVREAGRWYYIDGEMQQAPSAQFRRTSEGSVD